MWNSDALDGFNHESKRTLRKALQSIKTNSNPKRASVVRDERIRKAMLGMTCYPPYSVERFLTDVTEPEDGEEVFDTFGMKF